MKKLNRKYKVLVLLPLGVSGTKTLCEELYQDKNSFNDVEFIGINYDRKVKIAERELSAETLKEREKLKRILKEYISSKNFDLIHINTEEIPRDLLDFLISKYKTVYTVHAIRSYHYLLPLDNVKDNLTEEILKLVNSKNVIEEIDISTFVREEIRKTVDLNKDQERKLFDYILSTANQKYLLENADESVYVSRHVQDVAKQQFGIRKGIVINNGTGLFEDFEKQKDWFLKEAVSYRRNNLKRNSIVVSYIGRINRCKGVLDLGKVFEEVSKKDETLYLYLVGPSEDIFLERYFEDRIKENKRIRWIEKEKGVDRKGVITYYLISDIVVYPSLREAFGLTPIEASSLGRLTIVRKIDNMINFVKENIAFGFETTEELKNNLLTLSYQLKEIKENPTLPSSLEFLDEVYRKMMYTREKYSIKRVREEYLKCFEKLL